MVGIICAMQDEVQTILDHMSIDRVDHKGKRDYYVGSLYNQEIVVVFSRWGKVASAITTTQIINDYPLTEIIFTGVAGGVQENINIGDIIIGHNLYQHDLDARPFFDKFHIPILDKKCIALEKNEQLIQATEAFINDYNSFVDLHEAESFKITKPNYLVSDIASGDQFISSAVKIKELNQSLPTVSCVEMEGASVAQVCYEYEIPFSIIRTISDKADDDAEIDFMRFSQHVASKYALGIFKYYFS